MAAEAAIQRAIVGYLRAVVPGCKPIAIPNAAQRTWSGRATNAVPGLEPGATDLVVALPGGVTIWIEVKTPGGHLRLNQVDMHRDLRGLQHIVLVARSIDDVRDGLAAAGILTREAA